MKENSSTNTADLATTVAFAKELGNKRNALRISKELEHDFRAAAVASADGGDWGQVALMAVRYALRARKVGDIDAMTEGINTFDGAAVMGDEDAIRQILLEERRAKTQKRKEQRRRSKQV